MSKLTTRDYVWSAALQVASDKAESASSEWGLRFSIDQVYRAVPDDVDVSRRTVRDTLASMADLGHIDTHYRQGSYKALPPDPEPDETTEVDDEGDVTVAVTTERRPDR